MGKKRIYLRWTEEELNFLKENYYTLDWRTLCSRLQNRKWWTIVAQAKKIGAKRKRTLKNKLSNLLAETPEAYYWMGFLMADGNFSREQRVTLALAKPDLPHLLRYKNFIESTNSHYNVTDNYIRTCSTDVATVRALTVKFGLHNNKTKNPCNISNIENDDLFFSLFIGFFDGDGSISNLKHSPNSFTLSVGGSVSWKENFELFFNRILKIFDEEQTTQGPVINKTRTSLPQSPQSPHIKKEYQICSFRLSKLDLLQKIKRKADELNLPYMERKLGKIPA